MSEKARMLRGAYSAGFAAGLKTGIEQMRSEKWVKLKVESDYQLLHHGEIVKLLMPTIFGYIGDLIVRKDPDPECYWNTTFHRPDRLDSALAGRVDVCPWEIARRDIEWGI